jgi:hypothetical protein
LLRRPWRSRTRRRNRTQCRQLPLRLHHIVKSSGSALLNYEALDLIKRAAPLPAPSIEIGDSDLSVIVPIRFSASGR